MISYTAFTAAGTQHILNEDRILVQDTILKNGSADGSAPESLLAVICDGVGGEKGGAQAAQFAAESFGRSASRELSAYSVINKLHSINLMLLYQQKDENKRMATTAAGILLRGQKYCFFYIGDTRIYRFAAGTLTQLSTDHTSTEYGRNVLTRYLGGRGNACLPVVRCGQITVPPEEFLLCSDGVGKFLSDAEIQQILQSGISIAGQKEAILQRALQNGSEDDRSIVLIRCEN